MFFRLVLYNNSNRNMVINSLIEDNGSPVGKPGNGSGIYIEASAHNVISGNTVINNSQHWINVGGSPAAHNNIVLGNIVWGNFVHGIMLRKGASYNVVNGNVVYANGHDGIRVSKGDKFSSKMYCAP